MADLSRTDVASKDISRTPASGEGPDRAPFLGTGAERDRARGHHLTKFFAIAGNTFIESIRQPVFGIIVAVAVVLIALSPYMTFFTLMNSEKLIKDMGLATILLSGLLLSAFSASNVIAAEIDNKTVLTVISKPMGRVSFILGKFLGIAASLGLATYLLTLILTLSVGSGGWEASVQEVHWIVVAGIGAAFAVTVAAAAFANFFSDKPFASAAMIYAVPVFTICFAIYWFVRIKQGNMPSLIVIDPQVAYACVLVFWALLVLAAVAVAASTRIHVVVNVALCSMVFLLGLLSDYLFGRFAQQNLAARVAYAVVPNLQNFWMADVLAAGKRISLAYVGVAGLYAFCYMMAALMVAVALFQERQLS